MKMRSYWAWILGTLVVLPPGTYGKCKYSGWQKKMICDDESHESPNSSDQGPSSASEGKALAFKHTNAGKMAMKSKSKSSGSGRAKDSGYWPDPVALEKDAKANGQPATTKVAFMFLTRGPMPLEPLWAQFFGSEPKATTGTTSQPRLASVYLHPSPDFDCAKHFKPPSPFVGRCLPRALVVRTAWGSPALVQAARNLLSYALHDDPQNAYFALLSDSCIPLFPLR